MGLNKAIFTGVTVLSLFSSLPLLNESNNVTVSASTKYKSFSYIKARQLAEKAYENQNQSNKPNFKIYSKNVKRKGNSTYVIASYGANSNCYIKVTNLGNKAHVYTTIKGDHGNFSKNDYKVYNFNRSIYVKL